VTDPSACRIQFGDTADCPSPLRFDATAPKPEAKAGKSALRRSAGGAPNKYVAGLNRRVAWLSANHFSKTL
jgi:hypothetical protein